MNYYRRYMADYLSKTASLSMIEHGAYTLLLDYSYLSENGALPGDESDIFRLVRAVKQEEKKAIRKILTMFFRLSNNRFENDRVIKEIHKARPAIEAARANGLLGGRPRTNPEDNPPGNPPGSKKEPSAKASYPPTPNRLTPNPQPPPVLTPLSGKPDDAPSDVISVLLYLNTVCKANFRPVDTNVKFIKARLAEYGVDTLKRVVDRMAAQWAGTNMAKFLRPATLFNAEKCAQYVGQLDQPLPNRNGGGNGKFNSLAHGRKILEGIVEERMAGRVVGGSAASEDGGDIHGEVHPLLPGRGDIF